MPEQLLRITSVPIQMKYELEPARLEMKHDREKPVAELKKTPSQLETHSRNIRVNINTDAAYESMNLRGMAVFARDNAQKGRVKAQKGMGEAVDFGNQMQRIQDGVTIAQIVQSKMKEVPTTYHTFLPAVGPDVNWEDSELKMKYDPGHLDVNWQIMHNVMNFVPGKFSIMVTQIPRVQIEYMGDPLYVPPQANPNYEGPA